MTEGYNSTETNQSHHASLSAPVFDANASASAQPVEPIHSRSRIFNLRNTLHSLSRGITGQTRILWAVILIGLITGTLAGMLLVNFARTGQPATVTEVPATEPPTEMPVAETRHLDAFAAELAGSDGQTALSTATRHRRPRGRARSNRPRAYRVAIIR